MYAVGTTPHFPRTPPEMPDWYCLIQYSTAMCMCLVDATSHQPSLSAGFLQGGQMGPPQNGASCTGTVQHKHRLRMKAPLRSPCYCRTPGPSGAPSSALKSSLLLVLLLAETGGLFRAFLTGASGHWAPLEGWPMGALFLLGASGDVGAGAASRAVSVGVVGDDGAEWDWGWHAGGVLHSWADPLKIPPCAIGSSRGTPAHRTPP